MTEITVEIDKANPGPIFTVMDAQCGLCSHGARWIARNDFAGEFRIVPMQSAEGRALLMANDLDPDDPASWLYSENGTVHTGTDALIRVGQRLGGRWKALVALRLLPFAIREQIYTAVAQRRYIFGRTDLCNLPEPDVQQRLVQ